MDDPRWQDFDPGDRIDENSLAMSAEQFLSAFPVTHPNQQAYCGRVLLIDPQQCRRTPEPGSSARLVEFIEQLRRQVPTEHAVHPKGHTPIRGDHRPSLLEPFEHPPATALIEKIVTPLRGEPFEARRTTQEVDHLVGKVPEYLALQVVAREANVPHIEGALLEAARGRRR